MLAYYAFALLYVLMNKHERNTELLLLEQLNQFISDISHKIDNINLFSRLRSLKPAELKDNHN